MKALIGIAIRIYRKSPLHPHLGQRLAWLLTKVNTHLPRGLFVHQVGSFRMHIDLEQRIDAKIYFTGTWEPETVATIKKLVPAGGVCIDVGANIGYLSLVLASTVGVHGQVVAFEPTNWTYKRLRANIELNELPQIQTVQAGLAARTGVEEEMDIIYGYRLDGQLLTERQSIHLVRLDDYLAEHPLNRLDFIKCDTDGMEEQVFLGGIDALRRFKPAIHFELYQGQPTDQVATGERLLRTLEELGYEFFREGSLQLLGGSQEVLKALPPKQHCANVVAIIRASS